MFKKLKNWLFGINYKNETTKIEPTVVLSPEEPTEPKQPEIVEKVKPTQSRKIRKQLRKRGRGGRKPHNFKLG